jgi:glycosyltransferase involved in cell wall biosynthesis/ADP-heptose:LPS heptosyltransferase
MRIVIDMQGAQTGSRFRGIGRFAMSLSKAMVRRRGQHEIMLALNGLFPETLAPIFAEFSGLLPKENIHVWHALGPVRADSTANQLRGDIAEKTREAFLADLHPDVVLITSLFEGMTDDAIGSIGRLNDALPTAVILHDLIPLVNPDKHFQSIKILREWYFRKVASLERGRILLANSESSRQEALSALDFDPDSIVTISGACDDYFQVSDLAKSAQKKVWDKLGISKPFIMYIGGSDERKNLNRLIRAYAQLPIKIRQEHQLIFAGKMEGYARDYLNYANDSGLAKGELICTEYIEDADVLTLYNTCALFVFPSLHEGFGIPPLEAMACGAPVIGADATSLKEVIGLKEALFDPTSVDAISAKMLQGLTDERFRARLVEHGLKQCRTFSWDESAKRAMAALQRFDPQRPSHVSPLLTIEKTAIFAPRRIKILVLKLDHLGDFLLAIPAFSKLKARYPYATIDLIAGSWNIPIAKQLGFFDRIFTYDFFKQKSSERASVDAQALETLLNSLNEYDFAIDLRRQYESRFLLVKAKARFKVGYQSFNPEIDGGLDVALQAYDEPPFVITPLNKISISRQMIALVDALPGDVNDFLTFPEISQERRPEPWTIAIFPKAGTEAREWWPSNFIALVDRFLANSQIRGINIYFASQADATEFGVKPNSRLSVHIGLKFSELAESLAKNEVCIANNSGGGHLASYLGVTSIGIYSGHELFCEWGLQFNQGYVIHRAVHCAPCHGGRKVDCPHNLFCLNDISSDDVYTVAMDALTKTSLNGKNNFSKVLLQNNTDTIVSNLINSIADEVQGLSDKEAINLAGIISRNHPAYPVSAFPTIVMPNVYVHHNSGLIEWKGFSGIEPQFRWTEGNASEMRFTYPQSQPSSGTLELVVYDTLGKQRVTASFNGMPVLDQMLKGKTTLKMPVTNIKSGVNTLAFALPDAKIPGHGDERNLAVAVNGFRVHANEVVT